MSTVQREFVEVRRICKIRYMRSEIMLIKFMRYDGRIRRSNNEIVFVTCQITIFFTRPTVQVNLEESVPNEKFFNYPTASLTTNSLVLIGSEKFSSLGSLLHLLETR